MSIIIFSDDRYSVPVREVKHECTPAGPEFGRTLVHFMIIIMF